MIDVNPQTIFKMISIYLRALRAPFLAGSFVPVIIGGGLAYERNAFVLIYFIVTLIGVAGLHLGANLINDYYDAGGSDPINMRLTPFSGGSRVIQNGEMARTAILKLALMFFFVGVLSGLWLAFMGRPLVFVIGLMGLAAGWTYSAPPLQLMSRGWGEIVIFLAFGPLVTLGTYYVMSGSLSGIAFLLGIPQGFFITAVIWINQFPDYMADRQSGKNNLVVRLGLDHSRYVYSAFMLMAYGSILLMILFWKLPWLLLISFVSFPLANKAIKILWREYLSHEGVIPAQALTIQSLIAHGLLLSLTIGLSRFI